MKLLNIISPGNDSAIDDCIKLLTVNKPFKKSKKVNNLKIGNYGMNNVANVSGTVLVSSTGDGLSGGVE